MVDSWISVFLIAQNDAAAPDGFVSFFQGPGLLFLILPLLFYFMVLSPERRRRQEHAHMLGKLKKNDVVITVGGIYGTIVNVAEGSDDITLRIDDTTNARMRVLRSAVTRVVEDSKKSNSEGKKVEE